MSILYIKDKNGNFIPIPAIKGKDGYTPVKGVDYFTSEDKAEIIEEIEGVCIAKNQGSANVGKILVVGTDGNLTLADMPEGGTSGDVVGTLDESNNILLSGNLANGTYTLKYENADGTYTEIGSLVVGEIAPAYINLAEPNETNTTDFSIWCNDSRLGSDGTYREMKGYITTNYISVSPDDVIRVKGIEYDGTTYPNIGLYDTDKSRIYGNFIDTVAAQRLIEDLDTSTDVISFKIYSYGDAAGIRFLRICGKPTGTINDIIITKNEEIV